MFTPRLTVWGQRRCWSRLWWPSPATPRSNTGGAIPTAPLAYEGVRVAREPAVLRGRELPGDRATTWQAVRDDRALTVTITCREPDMRRLQATGRDRQRLDLMLNDMVEILWEPRLFWPCIAWRVNCAGARYVDIRGGTPRYDWQAYVRRDAAAWVARIRIPWGVLGRSGGARLPVRLNVSRYLPGRDPVTRVHTYRWVGVPAELAARRHSWSGVPVGLGWLR